MSLCYALMCAALVSGAKHFASTNMNHLEAELPSFVLSPTALLHPAHKSTNGSQQLHSDVGAVYAGLNYLPVPEPQDGNRRHLKEINHHNDMIREFQERRKYSRFEHARRHLDKDRQRFEEEDDEIDDGAPGPVVDDDEVDEEETLSGGLLDAYQTAPLSQGIGTHYATLYVGTPKAQPQTLIVDTGSHHTAFPCKPCSNCGEDHHTDKYFDPALSGTFQKLQCGDCTEDVNRSCSKGGECHLSQSYQEGSSWRAFQGKDMVYCGSNHPNNQVFDVEKLNKQFSMPFTFGCQNHLTGLFVTQLADGIMGMSASETTLPYQLHKNHKLEHNMFSMCFRRQATFSKEGVTAGVLTLGGVNTRLQRSPMVYAAMNINQNHGWYAIRAKKFWLRQGGGQSAKSDRPIQKTDYALISDKMKLLNSGSGIIVDSGTTDTYFHRSMRAPFAQAFKKFTGQAFTNKKMKLTKEELMALPTILIQMAPHKGEVDDSMDVDDVVGLAGTKLSANAPRDIILAIPATHYMEPQGDDLYIARVSFTESSGGVLGANAMMNHDILFDWENNRLGFAESTCDYEELIKSIEIVDEDQDLGDGVSKDCVLGKPVVQVSCYETVNMGSCEAGESTTEGFQALEMLIEEDGFGDGKSCKDVAVFNTRKFSMLGDDVEIQPTCDGDGVCKSLYKCSMKCEDATKLKAENDPSNSTAPEGMTVTCPNEGWGACQSSCSQSKVISKVRHDGDCHVHHVLKRPCHIDDCGRNDPCIIPYVVHAILLFADTDSELWSMDDEEQLVESFAKAVNMEREKGDELFVPGSVKILSVGSWKADEFYEGEVESGMEVVLEISIHNDKAILPGPNEKNAQKGAAKATDQVKHFITGPEHASCSESDIYRLSRNALHVHQEMERPNFMREVIEMIRESAGHDALMNRGSVFVSVGDEGEGVDKSEVLSSWTIKTEVNSLFDGGFEQFNTKDNLGIEIAFFILLLFVCCCGSCFGSYCASRRYRLIDAKNALLERAEQARKEKERGQYATVGGGGGGEIDDVNGEVELGNIDSFHDNPVETVEDFTEDLDFDDDLGDKMNRLK